MMTPILSLLVWLMAGSSCLDSQTSTSESSSLPETPGISTDSVRISGKVQFTRPYCGGAAPSEEMLEETTRPQPLTGYKVFIRRGSTNENKAGELLSLTTNSDGIWETRLPPGEYCLLRSEKLMEELPDFSNSPYETFDAKCFEQWQAACDRVFTVGEAPVENLDLVIHYQCFVSRQIPCLQYTGPMPP